MRLLHILRQSLKCRVDVAEDGIAYRRTGRFLRIGREGDKLSPLRQVWARLILVIAKDRRTNDEDQVVPA